MTYYITGIVGFIFLTVALAAAIWTLSKASRERKKRDLYRRAEQAGRDRIAEGETHAH